MTDRLVSIFPLPESAIADVDFLRLCERLMEELKNSAVRKAINSRENQDLTLIEYDEYSAVRSKTTIDQIDKRLARHFQLDPEEVEAICAFDLKYRSGIHDSND